MLLYRELGFLFKRALALNLGAFLYSYGTAAHMEAGALALSVTSTTGRRCGLKLVARLAAPAFPVYTHLVYNPFHRQHHPPFLFHHPTFALQHLPSFQLSSFTQPTRPVTPWTVIFSANNNFRETHSLSQLTHSLIATNLKMPSKLLSQMVMVLMASSGVLAHMELMKPFPILSKRDPKNAGKQDIDYTMTRPLANAEEGGAPDYPCFGYHTKEAHSVETYAAGQTYEMQYVPSPPRYAHDHC